MPERGLTMIPATWLDFFASIFGAFGVWWLKARGLVSEFPGTVLVLWFLSFVLGVWL
jgi:hypothetical protein